MKPADEWCGLATVAGLETGHAVLPQEGQEAGVVMGVHPRLDGGSLGMVDQLDERHPTLTEHLVEMIGREAEPDAHRRHQLVGDRTHLALEALDERTERRQRRVGSLVGAVEAQVRREDVAVAGRMLGPHVDLLAEVDGVIGQLATDAFPAAERR
jgi:hypothetical protein